MNVYDFDGTIFYPDSAASFAMWCVKRHPTLLFTYLPKAKKSLKLYKEKKIPRYKMQRDVYTFLGKVKDLDVQVEKFWDKYEGNISSWYLKQKRPDDLIISASPTYLIAPIAKRLGVKYVATEFDREFNVFVNNLMYGKGKSKYIIDHDFPLIEKFYSDSLADTPLALCSEKAYLVTDKAQKINDWPKLDFEILKIVNEKIDTGWEIFI